MLHFGSIRIAVTVNSIIRGEFFNQFWTAAHPGCAFGAASGSQDLLPPLEAAKQIQVEKHPPGAVIDCYFNPIDPNCYVGAASKV